MKQFIVFLFTAMICGAQKTDEVAQFSPSGDLLRPADYREWIYLSSGLGMNYAEGAVSASPTFQNVFVMPAAYRSFQKNGVWPLGTIFILELRKSQTEGSINKSGKYQGEITGIEAEVKSDRFPNQWAFFSFAEGAKTGKMFPATASCYSCHARNGAVDNTFVQFYPTLIGTAQQKGTFKTPSQ